MNTCHPKPRTDLDGYTGIIIEIYNAGGVACEGVVFAKLISTMNLATFTLLMEAAAGARLVRRLTNQQVELTFDGVRFATRIGRFIDRVTR